MFEKASKELKILAKSYKQTAKDVKRKNLDLELSMVYGLIAFTVVIVIGILFPLRDSSLDLWLLLAPVVFVMIPAANMMFDAVRFRSYGCVSPFGHFSLESPEPIKYITTIMNEEQAGPIQRRFGIFELNGSNAKYWPIYGGGKSGYIIVPDDENERGYVRLGNSVAILNDARETSYPSLPLDFQIGLSKLPRFTGNSPIYFAVYPLKEEVRNQLIRAFAPGKGKKVLGDIMYQWAIANEDRTSADTALHRVLKRHYDTFGKSSLRYKTPPRTRDEENIRDDEE